MNKFRIMLSRPMFIIFLSMFISLGLYGGTVAFAQTEEATTSTNVLFILDGSGSMAGQVEGKVKMDVASEVMTDLINGLPDSVNVGLVAYGHRTKGDCSDIETMVVMGKVDKENLTQKIGSIRPKGKTPIAKSLQIAGDELQAVEDETTVVLVSDGEETCDGDPCALVKSLKEQGINVKVHVVGFDVGDKEKEQLSCIADAGGGKYFTANNADQLQEALAEVGEEVTAGADVPKMDPLPKGGDMVETAVPLAPGDYATDHIIAKGMREYFSVLIKPGQTLTVGFRTPDTANPYAGASIHNEDGNLLIKETIIGSPGTLKSISWTPGSMKDEYTYYIGVGNDYDANAEGTAYYIKIEDNFDAGSTTDAGDVFDNALEIKPGEYVGFLSGTRGDDKKDFYAITVNAEQKVRAKVKPETDTGFKVTIYDQDRVKVGTKTAANPGAIARVSWTAPEDQEVVYILVEPRNYSAKSSVLKYDLNVAVE